MGVGVGVACGQVPTELREAVMLVDVYKLCLRNITVHNGCTEDSSLTV